MHKFLSELQRRKVLRIASGYVVAGWIILQVALSLQAAMKLPDWFSTIMVSLLIIGFPIAVLVSWFFEITPQGIRRTVAAGDGAMIKPQTTDIALAAALGIVVVMIAVGWFNSAPEPPASKLAAPEVAVSSASIAVLPFADLSPAKDQEYFSDGIAEEILNVLAHTDGLKVASRTSAFQFRKTNSGIPAIAKSLGVRHVLEGSVRRAGDTVRITAQLIDAQTDAHLWSQTFDRPLTTATIFAIQDEIAQAIVGQLASSIGSTVAAPKPLIKTGTDNLDAYDLYLKGHELFIKRGSDNIREATRQLKLAVVKDPKFARAWEELSAVFAVSDSWGLNEEKDYSQLALEAADTALRLDPSLSMPFAVRGNVQTGAGARGKETDWDEGMASFAQALKRDPRNATAWGWRAMAHLALGYFDRAKEDANKCLEIDPAYEICRRNLAFAHLYAGQDTEALSQFVMGLQKGCHADDADFVFAIASHGDTIGVLTILATDYEDDAPQLVQPLFRALTDPKFSDSERKSALALLESLKLRRIYEPLARLILKDYDRIPAATEARSPWWIRGDPVFLKSQARKKLMSEWRLPEYWRKHGFPPQCKPVGKDDFECN